ncbi:MAG: hypothetical protein HKN25_06200 [Pyrinomonadaceae bacterium]|nr:hypothetical protein [Pyrinomonadaceae bacterium]
MRKNVVLAAAALLLAMTFSVPAQSNTSFAGDWTLDMDKSQLGERSRVESMTMKVTQSDNELTYERKVEREAREGGGGGRGMGRGRGGNVGAIAFNLDGTETKAEGGGRRGGKVTLQAKMLEGGNLELHQTRSFEGPMGAISIKTVETWELSEDGKTLTVSSETETPRGNRSAKMVFSKN